MHLQGRSESKISQALFFRRNFTVFGKNKEIFEYLSIEMSCIIENWYTYLWYRVLCLCKISNKSNAPNILF